MMPISRIDDTIWAYFLVRKIFFVSTEVILASFNRLGLQNKAPFYGALFILIVKLIRHFLKISPLKFILESDFLLFS